MSISRVYLCLIFLTLFTSSPVLCSRSPKLAAPSASIGNKHQKGHVHSPAMLVSGSPKVDSLSSMAKIDEPTTKSAIAGFFRYRLPFQGWPFHKYPPFPMVKPTNPSSVPTNPSSGAAEVDQSEKVPSSPNKGNGDGGNA
ncbi:hypothetical protein V5N11_011592 [Cardamine amara subsp. amara]|uniref:Uncharacterized protein n=1 Tax=Cardamine amara subsp. amara TaxID=228776 RepID=A0ABD1AGU0_CARAN